MFGWTTIKDVFFYNPKKQEVRVKKFPHSGCRMEVVTYDGEKYDTSVSEVFSLVNGDVVSIHGLPKERKFRFAQGDFIEVT